MTTGPALRPPLKLGFAVPVFANPGVPNLRTPSSEQLDWATTADAVSKAEDLGYDSAWLSDHMFLGRDGAFLESWTTVSALAGSTGHIRLVNNHFCNNFRHAPLTAKMAATLDVISGGRFDLYLSPGGRKREHVSYGFGWEPDRAVRARKLTEAVRLIRAMWSGEPTDFDGEFYSVRDAICAPQPVQPGGPPIWIGEHFDDTTLDLIARHADGWNALPSSPDELRQKVESVREACSTVGRDPATLALSLETQVLILDGPDQWDEWVRHWRRLQQAHPVGHAMSDMPGVERILPYEQYQKRFIVGTRDEVTQRLLDYRDLGVDEVVCWFMDFPSDRSMRILSEEIRPRLAG